MGEPDSLLLNVFIYLLVALLAVPAAKRLGLGPVLGYLLAGIFIGPWGLALIREANYIELLSSVATVLMLFLISLQATPARIRQLRSMAGSLGFLQYFISTALIFIVALLIGLRWHHALIAGLALSMSSGAIAIDAFRDRYPGGSSLSSTGNRILLAQSLLMVPLVVVLPLLAIDAIITQGSAWPTVLVGVCVLGVFGFIGHRALGQVFRLVVNVGLDDVFAAFALVLIIGLLLLVQLLQLPVELAALLAGLLLVRSEYGSAITIALRPFAGLLAGLFFVSIGLGIDFGPFLKKPLETIALVALLVSVKGWVLRSVLRWSSVPRQQRIWLATVLSQAGELGFIILSLVVSYNAMPAKLADQLMMVIALSMLSTPLLLIFAERRDTLPARQQPNSGLALGESADSQVIVAGYGRMGSVIAKLLAGNHFRVSAIDNKPERFAALRRDGFIGFYGDALRPDLLKAAGASRASVLVIAIDDSERAADLVRRVKRDYPRMTIIGRAVDSTDRDRLVEDGADRAYCETFETALLMGEDVLELVGVSPLEAQALIESFRDANQTQ